MLHYSLTSDADVDMRITSATAAFGAIKKKCWQVSFGGTLGWSIQGPYLAYFTLGLRSWEAWSLREDLFKRLRSFHNMCARSMCRVDLHHFFRNHTTSASLCLFRRLGILDSWPGLRFPFPRNSRAMAKNFTSRGISTGFPRYFRAVVIKALLNSRRRNHVWLVKNSLSAGIPRNFPWETEGIRWVDRHCQGQAVVETADSLHSQTSWCLMAEGHLESNWLRLH